MYYNVIKHSSHLSTLEKCRKHLPAARVLYISLMFSNARCVLSQCNTQLRLLYYFVNLSPNFPSQHDTQRKLGLFEQTNKRKILGDMLTVGCEAWNLKGISLAWKSCRIHPGCVTIQMKAIGHYFHVVLFIMLYKVVLTFKSVDETDPSG